MALVADGASFMPRSPFVRRVRARAQQHEGRHSSPKPCDAPAPCSSSRAAWRLATRWSRRCGSRRLSGARLRRPRLRRRFLGRRRLLARCRLLARRGGFLAPLLARLLAASESSAGRRAPRPRRRRPSSSAQSTGSRPSTFIGGIGWPISFSIASTAARSSGVAMVKACPPAQRARSGRCGAHSPRHDAARRS